MKTSNSRKLSPQATLSGLLVALFILFMASTPGFATTYNSTWIANTGIWFTDSNWSSDPLGGGHPSNDGNKYNVTIPNNPSTVNVDGEYHINNLTVDPGAIVNISAISSAVRGIDIDSGGTITNNGAINLTTGGGNTARIYGWVHDLTITGSGTITLGSANSIISFPSGAYTLTNDMYHTIQGGGHIGTYSGTSAVGFINKGTVIANNNSVPMVINNTAYLSYLGLDNQGTLRVATGSTMDIEGRFHNYSSSILTGGTYEVQGSGRMFFPLDSSQDITHNAATVILDGSSASILRGSSPGYNTDVFNHLAQNDAGGSFTIKNGKNFTTAGDFTNHGSLTVGQDSKFTVTGNYTQASRLNLDIFDTSHYGALDVKGTANLDGDLDITLLLGYTVNPGDIFDLFNYSSHIGTFSSINEIGGDGTLIFVPDYRDTGLYVTASNVPLPGSVLLLGSGLLGLLGLRRKFKG